MFVIGAGTDSVHQYTLGTAWDVTATVTYNTSKSVATQDNNPRDVFFKPDGTRLFVVGTGSGTMHQYDLGTAWDLGGTMTNTGSYLLTAQEASPTGLFFKPDGSRFFVTGFGGDAVQQFDLGTAWSITGTVGFEGAYSVLTEDGSSQGLFFKPDGTRFFIAGQTTDSVLQYDLD
jgi:DNA-binding beta-propeller fold protein YncE